MNVRVDGIADLERDLRDESKRLGKMPRAVLATAKSAADVERSTHAYRNRTGRLHGLTGAELYETGDGFEVHLHQGAYYGAYLQGFGPPWSNFERIAQTAEEQVDEIVAGKP